jgi:uncharacterized protein with von Willebrand factor type A (vWA) domain
MTDTAHTAHATLERRPPSATSDLDLPAVAVALSRRLYAAGLPITPQRAMNFVDAVRLIGPPSRSSLYCTARTVFVSDPGHLPAFDQVFATVFAHCADPEPV